jgi:hypothetical protein
MSLNLSLPGKIKTGFHAVQAALIFIAACVALAMDTKQGHSDGRGRWFNILVLRPWSFCIRLPG